MGEDHHENNKHPYQFLLRQPRAAGKLKYAGGEIVEVQGGHIVRSTGRKDRHSKVCTAKGPRDRRVRLSAHTAIQFYDVQDRLGYDRPSKAVDWLIKNAKSAIDELAKLPPWDPTADPSPPHPGQPIPQNPESDYPFGAPSTAFLPPSLDSDSIADTIKSFFPVSGASAVPSSSSSPVGFQNYTSDAAQDLRLSLQSFQDPILHHHHPSSTTITTTAGERVFANYMAYDAAPANWSEHWSGATESGGGGGNGGFMYNIPPASLPGVPLSALLGQSPFLSQRGPLQSSNSPSVRAWIDPITAANDGAHGFGSGGFSGFRVPARIQGEEEHDGFSEKLSSASRR